MSSSVTEQAEILVFLEHFHSIWSSENYADACWLQNEKEKEEQREVQSWGKKNLRQEALLDWSSSIEGNTHRKDPNQPFFK